MKLFKFLKPQRNDPGFISRLAIVSRMSRKIVARLSAVVLFVLIGVVAYTQNPSAPPDLKINKVTENLYSIEGDGGNVAVYVTGNGVILVDDKFERPDHLDPEVARKYSGETAG